MKNVVELEKSSAPEMKNLPEREHAPEIAAGRKFNDVIEPRDARGSAQAPLPLPHASLAASVTAASLQPLTHEITAPHAPSRVERLTHAMLETVAQVRRVGPESIAVVLKPDAGTELLLRVEMRDGALSAQLQFGRGDRAFLDRHWDDLQKRLAEQGVQLSRGEDFGLGGGNHFAPPRRHPYAGEEPQVLAPVRAHTTTSSTKAPAVTRGARGFESWA